jgi:undecaprenyl-diphosphatase
MAAATGYDLLKYLKSPAEGVAPANGAILVAIGMVISFVVAYAVIAWFMNWVKQRGFTPFAIYRILLGAVVLFWALKQ